MKRYLSYGSGIHYCDIVFNDVPDGDPLTVHEIGSSFSPNGESKIFLRDSYYIHFVISGHGYFMNKELSAGCGYLMIPGEYSRFVSDENDPWHQSWIQVTGKGAGELLKKSGFFNKNHVFSHPTVPIIAQKLHDAVYDDYDNYDINLRFTSILYEILSLHRHATMPDPSSFNIKRADTHLSMALRYIKENYTNDIRTADIVKFVNVTPNHLCKIFKKYTGATLKDYLARYRISEAQKLLIETDLNINEISNAVGYYDSMYFSQVFRRYSNHTPTEFRRIFGES